MKLRKPEVIKLRKPEDPRYKIDRSRKVFVYKNLHKNCWSVRQDGLVKAHAKCLYMWDCLFQVNQKGRERVIKEKQKNVHAGILGYITNVPVRNVGLKPIGYNPYKYKTFVQGLSQKPIYHSQEVVLSTFLNFLSDYTYEN